MMIIEKLCSPRKMVGNNATAKQSYVTSTNDTNVGWQKLTTCQISVFLTTA